MSYPEHTARFCAVYNDRETYPSIADVALELGVSYQTVRNHAAIIRGRKRRGEEVPELISRVITAKPADNDNQLSPRQHALRRAETLQSDVTAL